MLSDLPYITQIKKLKHELNSHYDIRKAPGDITGVQQSLTARLIPCLTSLVENATDKVPSCFRVKLTGDGTQIGRGLTVVNVAEKVTKHVQQVKITALASLKFQRTTTHSSLVPCKISSLKQKTLEMSQ